MGRTVPTFHQLIEQAQARFAPYRRALRREDQRVFDELFARVKYYAPSGSMDAPASPLDTIFFTLLLEQQKRLRALAARLRRLETAHGVHGLAVRSLPGARGDGAVDD